MTTKMEDKKSSITANNLMNYNSYLEKYIDIKFLGIFFRNF